MESADEGMKLRRDGNKIRGKDFCMGVGFVGLPGVDVKVKEVHMDGRSSGISFKSGFNRAHFWADVGFVAPLSCMAVQLPVAEFDLLP